MQRFLFNCILYPKIVLFFSGLFRSLLHVPLTYLMTYIYLNENNMSCNQTIILYHILILIRKTIEQKNTSVSNAFLETKRHSIFYDIDISSKIYSFRYDLCKCRYIKDKRSHTKYKITK